MREPFQTIFIAGLNSQKLMSPVNFIILTSPSVSPGLRLPAGAHRIMLLEDIFTLDIFRAQVLMCHVSFTSALQHPAAVLLNGTQTHYILFWTINLCRIPEKIHQLLMQRNLKAEIGVK